MRRIVAILLVILSLMGQSRSAFTTARYIYRVSRLPSIDGTSQLGPVDDRSMFRIRGGESSLSAIASSTVFLGPINTFFQQHPFVTAFLICSMKASLADAFAQFLSKRQKGRFDAKRNLGLMLYGGFYQGCGQEFIYNRLFSTMFGTKTVWRTVLSKVSFDMFAIQPFLSLPIAYGIKALVMGETMKEAKERYKTDIRHNHLLQSCWKVWIPTQTIAFTIIPTHLRITFMACVSFFWLILFSTISASSYSTTSEGTALTSRSDEEINLQHSATKL